MARIADYLVLGDSQRELEIPTSIPTRRPREEFTFTLESGAHVHSRAILAFVLEVDNANDLIFRVNINDTTERDYAFSGSRPSGTHHEALNRDVLHATGENSIRFRLSDGTGVVRFSDVVLYYQREI